MKSVLVKIQIKFRKIILTYEINKIKIVVIQIYALQFNYLKIFKSYMLSIIEQY